MGELAIIFKMFELIYKIPSRAEPWILPKDKNEPSKVDRNFVKKALEAIFPEKVKEIDDCIDLGDFHDESPLMGMIDEVQVHIAGMTYFWKFVNMVLVALPKLFLWKLTAETGVTILMETAGIDDLITNSVGLTFILGLDELIGSALMREETLMFVRACEDFDLFDATTSCVGDMSKLSEDEILQKYNQTQHGVRSITFRDLINLLPTKLIATILATMLFVYEYYWRHCTYNADDGDRLVSKTMYTPSTVEFTWLNAILPNIFPVPKDDLPYWEMPD